MNVSDDATKTSWIDHILCSCSADTVISNINDINEVVISDHNLINNINITYQSISRTATQIANCLLC